MKWILLCVMVFIQSAVSQITIQGTVKSSNSRGTPLSTATVQFTRFEISGTDTARFPQKTVETDANGAFSSQFTTDVKTDDRLVPQQFELSDGYPNPFADQTQIDLHVPVQDKFSVTVYNILGQQVASAVRILPTGSYAIQWKGADIPGVYFAAIHSGGHRKVVKLVQLTRGRVVSDLKIVAGPGGVMSKRSGVRSQAATILMQVTVTKPAYHSYSTPLLSFTSRTLNIAMSYAGTGTVTTAVRESAITQTSAQFVQLLNTKPTLEAAKAMADWLKTRPEFEDAGISSSGDAWARFKDGRLMLFVNNRKPGVVSNSYAMAPRAVQRGESLQKNPSNIPGSNKALVFDALGPAFLDVGVKVLAQLKKAEYSVGSVNDGSVPALKGLVDDAGIFYMGGHGGTGEMDNASAEFAVWTGSTQSALGDSLYKDDLKHHRLVYMTAAYDIVGGVNQFETHYAYTHLFVSEYMSFADNSLVYLDACLTATDMDFVGSFVSKGASVVAGWSDVVNSDKCEITSTNFFSRTLGVDVEVADKETPPQRPFDWERVYEWMQTKQYDFGNGTGTCLLTFLSSVNSNAPGGPLAPSIASMWVHPYDKKLTIYGIFGDDPGGDGRVTVGGSQRNVQSWGYDSQAEMDKIVCEIPDDGAGSYGDVQVTVRKIKSNISPLSRYKGAFTLVHETTDGRQYEVKLTLQFRVHLLGFRLKPGDAPTFNKMSYVVNADMGSKGESRASGSTAGQVVWAGQNGDLHNNIDGGESPTSFIAGAWFDPEKRIMQLYLSGVVDKGITQIMGPTTLPIPIIFGLDEFDGKKASFPSYVEIPLASDFSIAKGSVSAKKVGTYFSMLAPMADKVRIEWDDITCDFPPKDETKR